MGHRGHLLVTHKLSDPRSGLPTVPTRQRPPRERLRSNGQFGSQFPKSGVLTSLRLPFAFSLVNKRYGEFVANLTFI